MPRAAGRRSGARHKVGVRVEPGSPDPDRPKVCRVRHRPAPVPVRRRRPARCCSRAPAARERRQGRLQPEQQRARPAAPLDAVTGRPRAQGRADGDPEDHAVHGRRQTTAQGAHRRAPAPAVKADDVVSADYLMLNGKDGKQLDASFGKAAGDDGPRRPADLLPGLHQGPGRRRRSAAACSSRSRRPTRFGTQRQPAARRRGDRHHRSSCSTSSRVTRAADAARPAQAVRAEGRPADRQGRRPGKPAQITIPKTRGAHQARRPAADRGHGRGGQGRPDPQARQYTGVLWKDGSDLRLLAGKGGSRDFPIGVGQVIPGWDKALVGQKVGSRVLLVIPPGRRLRHRRAARRPRSRAPTRWSSSSTSSTPTDRTGTAPPHRTVHRRRNAAHGASTPARTKPEIDFPGDAAAGRPRHRGPHRRRRPRGQGRRHRQRPLRRRGALHRRGVRRLLEPRRAAGLPARRRPGHPGLGRGHRRA